MKDNNKNSWLVIVFSFLLVPLFLGLSIFALKYKVFVFGLTDTTSGFEFSKIGSPFLFWLSTIIFIFLGIYELVWCIRQAYSKIKKNKNRKI